jgi:hypothetical protein
MDEILHVAEIGTAGIAASIGAFALGLYRVEILMAVFFAVTFGGQLVAAMIARTSAIGSDSAERATHE